MIPTPEEKKNGWTEASLSKYVAEREKAQSTALDITSPQRRKRPTEQNHRYSPLRWRK
jgi:hypothetical protein